MAPSYSQWQRVTWVLPISPEIEVKVTGPRRMSSAAWARMLELLESLRPGIVLEEEEAAGDG